MDVYHYRMLHSNTGQMIVIEVDLSGFSILFDEETIDAASAQEMKNNYDRLMAPYVGEESPWLDEENRPVTCVNLLDELDLAPDPELEVETHPAILSAREALMDTWEEWEAEGLTYSIALEQSEAQAIVGGSRWGGDPDLPSGVDWPGETTFIFQINFAEVHPFDLQNQLPSKGMLYFFLADDAAESVVFFSDAKKLRSVSRPEAFPVPSYVNDELKPRGLTFSPIVRADHVSTDLPADVLDMLRSDLHSEVTFSGASNRFFGLPSGEWEMEVFNHYTGPRELSLVVQVMFLDGYLYLAMPSGDLKEGISETAVTAYWGT